jgi:hypothetical protein
MDLFKFGCEKMKILLESPSRRDGIFLACGIMIKSSSRRDEMSIDPFKHDFYHTITFRMDSRPDLIYSYIASRRDGIFLATD